MLRRMMCLFLGIAVWETSAAAQKLTTEQQLEVRELVAAADNAMTDRFTPVADWVEVQWHCLRGPSGETYVPFTVSLDPELFPPLSSVALYIRVAQRGERTTSADYVRRSLGPEPGQSLPVFSYDAAAAASVNLRAIDKATKQHGPFLFQAVHFAPLPDSRGRRQVQRAFAVPRGSYDVYFVLREQNAKTAEGRRWGVVKRVIEVPDLSGSGLMVTSPIMAADIRALTRAVSPEQQGAHPYALGAVEVVPASAASIGRLQDLTAVVFVHNASTDAGGKPAVTVDYRLWAVEANAMAREVGTVQRLRLDAGTLPKEFDLRKGHQLVPLHPIAVADLDPGAYRLDVKVMDDRTSAIATSSAAFNVGLGR